MVTASQGFWGRFSVTWSGYSATRRYLFGISMLLGVVVLVAGIAVDVWWSWGTFSFLPNALTSFAGFCIGVPVALLVLATLQAETEENSQLAKLHGLSASAMSDFVERVETFCSGARFRALELATSEVVVLWSEMIEAARQYTGNPRVQSSVYGWNFPERTPAEYEAFVTSFRSSIRQLSRHLDLVTAQLPDGLTITIEWMGVRRSWNVLDTYVRVQRFERQLSWMTPQRENRIQHKLLESGNPMT